MKLSFQKQDKHVLELALQIFPNNSTNDIHHILEMRSAFGERMEELGMDQAIKNYKLVKLLELMIVLPQLSI